MGSFRRTPRGHAPTATGSRTTDDRRGNRAVGVNVERLSVGAVVALIGLGAIVGGIDYGIVRETGGIGAGAVPLVVGILLLVEGLLLGNDARTRPSPTSPPPDDASSKDQATSEDDGTPGIERESLAGPLLLVAMLAGVLLLTPYVGFVGIIAVFAFIAARFLERLSLRTSVLLGLIAGGFIWVVFIWLLDVRLPVLPTFL